MSGEWYNDGCANRNPEGVRFWTLVREDFARHDRDILSQGFWTLFWHRFGNWRMSIGPKTLRLPPTILYRVMSKLCEWWSGILLPYTVIVGRRVKLEHFGGMILVANKIGDDVIIRQNTTFGIAGLDDLTGRPVIGDRVELGAGVVAVGRIEIGSDTVIGANAVVTRNIPSGVIAVGVPARVIKAKNPELDTETVPEPIKTAADG